MISPVSDKTFSLCPVCNKKLSAEISEKNEKLFISKYCSEHGNFEALHPWEDPVIYRFIREIFSKVNNECTPLGLIINLTDRCNQKCLFCFQNSGPENNLTEPDMHKIDSLLDNFRGNTVFLCGGEPTLRDDLFDIIKKIKKRGFRVSVFTNGKRVADEKYAALLRETGVDLVILQFDSFNDENLITLRGEKLLSIKCKALENLRKEKIPVYLFSMIVKEINEIEIKALHNFFLDSEEVKILNLNPVWEMGRFKESSVRLTNSEIIYRLEKAQIITKTEILLNTEFSFLAGEFFKLFKNIKLNLHPMCELRTYYFFVGNCYRATHEFLELEKLNKKLWTLLAFTRKQNALLRKPLLLFIILPFYFNVKKGFRFSLLAFFFKQALKGSALFKLMVKSLIIGTFHSHKNNDLRFIESCNLFSDNPDSLETESSCLRQIKQMKCK